MTVVKTRVKAGKVEFTAPRDWPEGVVVELEARLALPEGDDDLMSPEEIEQKLASVKVLREMAKGATGHAEIEAYINESKQREKAIISAS